ncbi:MAG TPA: DUF3775 domain-containing protein [Thiotrichales bacterium]|nr:DUF3775 domain-containing protein [Thiotrichales bacterium]
MLDINPDIVCAIIDRAREFQAKEDVVFPEDGMNPTDDWAMQTLANHHDDLTYLELKSAIEDLEPDQQATLVALMWLGREDFTIDEWDRALAQANENWNDHTADYLISTPLVADYLQEGLRLHGHECE